MRKPFDPKTSILHPLNGLESAPATADGDTERAGDKAIQGALHKYSDVFANVAYDDLPAWAQAELGD